MPGDAASHALLRRVCGGSSPPVPGTTLRLLFDLLVDEDVPQDYLQELIAAEPAVCHGFILLGNQWPWGQPQIVRNHQQALRQLGRRGALAAVWLLAVRDAIFSMPSFPDRARQRLWRHLLLSAWLTRVLFHAQPMEDRITAFIAALTHDLGHLLLPQPGARWNVVWHSDHDRAGDEIRPLRPEDDHSRLGSCLLDLWHAPASLISTALYHHQPWKAPPVFRSLVAGVRLVDLLAEQLDADHLPAGSSFLHHPEVEPLRTITPWDQLPELETTLISELPSAMLTVEQLAGLLAPA